jgi:hypothetical protein
MIRRINPTESQIQISVIEQCSRIKIPGTKYFIKDFLFKISNEGKRSWAQGKKMKAEGLTAGVSDLILAYPIFWVNNYDTYDKGGLWIELKEKGKKPTPLQTRFLKLMREVGYEADWRDSVDGAMAFIKYYLGMK